MAILKNKIDFLFTIVVEKANPNGDPSNVNQPRMDPDGNGEMSDVCIKRKIRQRMLDLGNKVLLILSDGEPDSIKGKVDASGINDKISKDDYKQEAYRKAACEEWLDVRSFGQVFAFKDVKASGVSLGVHGPVSVQYATSIEPIIICPQNITKGINGVHSMQRGTDTIGMKYFVDKAVYVCKGGISPSLAERTGFSDEDAEVIKEALKTLFEGDSSSARPVGSMGVGHLYWWEQKVHLHSPIKVHNSISVIPKKEYPYYEIRNNYDLENLEPEIYKMI